MAAQPVIDMDYMNLEKESSYAFVSDMFEFNWIKRACNCYNANNLHEQIKFTIDVSALINPTATPRCSFDNLAISCFPNVWILTMYKIANTRFILL